MDVSIIIPIYKGNGYIESLLNKIEKNYQGSQKEIEVIFVNDYPDEEIIVGSQHDFPIRIINNEMNQGIHQTRINGLKKAVGKYILFLDQDDEISDFFIKSQLEHIGDADLCIANGIMESEDTTDKFGLMPYLSEDGSKNVFILNVNRFYGLNKKLENDPEKLEDALKVMKVLSTVEGTSALYPESTLKAGLLPFKDAKADDTYYADISDFINAGNTRPFIYSGWENTIVNSGTNMQEFMQDKASIKDVADQLDEDQDSVVNNQPEVITTATEEISQESCAKLVGRCFAEATGSDIALISLGTWISGNGTNQNNGGVSGKLYAKNITDYDICTILPTGWSQTIQTVRLTGKQIQDLYKEGYDAVGTGNNYPYVLVSPMELEDEKTYQVAISGISEKLASEAEVIDSGIVGMDAAKEFFGQFETLSEADAEWK